MATPRKHWFRVADSIAREAWSNDVLATVVRLMGALNGQWARDGLTAEESCTIELRPADILALTGSQDARTAQRRCHQAAIAVQAECTFVANPLDPRRKLCRFFWPKWAEFQALYSREQGEPKEEQARGMPPPHTPPQDAPAPEEEEGILAPVVALPAPVGTKPTKFEGEAREAILVWAKKRKIGPKHLAEAMEKFNEWVPLKKQHRTQAQWVSSFQRIAREEQDKRPAEVEASEKPCRCTVAVRSRMEVQRMRCDGCDGHLEQRNLARVQIKE